MHFGLNIGNLGRNAPFAQSARAVGGYQQIVFNSDTAEIEIFGHLGIVDKLLVKVLDAPFFEQFGNEINSRLVGHHKTRLQLAAHP